MKEKIQVLEYSKEILKATEKGILLTTKNGEKINSMVISWGTLGIQWNKPIFTVFIRENRYTKTLIDQNPEFTINIPLGEYNKKIMSICGSKSGKEIDKIKELKLTLEEPEKISVPAIKELPLTLECKVIYKQAQNPNEITDENKLRFYPENIHSDYHGSNKDYHTAYYGEIVSAYIIK